MLKGDVSLVLGDLKDAEEWHQKAVAMAENGGLSEQLKIEAFICVQASIYSQGKNDQALENLTPLLDNPSLTVRNIALLKRTLGNIYRSAANLHLAIKFLSEAIELAKELGDVIHEMEWTGELGRVYRSSGLHHEAITKQKEAYEAALARGDIARLAAACGYIGFTMYSLPSPNYSEAIKYIGTRLLLADKKLGDSVSVRWCLNNIGKVYLGLKSIEPAIQCFQKSLEEAKRMGDLLGEGTAFGNLGSALRDAGKHQEAIDCHKNYLQNAQKRLDTGGAAIMLYELAVDYLLMNDLSKATDYALQGVVTLNTIRSQLTETDDQLKIGNFEKNQTKLYNILQQLLVKQAQYNNALLISELGRAQALTDLVQAKLSIQSSFARTLTKFIHKNTTIDQLVVDDALSQLYSLCTDLATTLVMYSVVNEISESNERSSWVYIWVVTASQTVHFAKSQFGRESVKFQLDEDFFSSLRRDFGVRGIKLVSKQKNAQVSSGAQLKVTNTPKSPAKSGENSSDTSKLTNETTLSSVNNPSLIYNSKERLSTLYECLLSPIRSYLPHCSGGDTPHLILLPHDMIYNVPFPALSDGNKYFIEDYSLSQAPSLSLLHLLTRNQKTAKTTSNTRKDSLIVADPTMPHEGIPQLPGAQEEANNVQKIIGGIVLTRDEADKETVLSHLTSHSIIHFATHATVFDSLAEHIELEETEDSVASVTDGDYSIKGAIVLASSSPTCSGILTSQELQDINLDCELLTLSCCRTACGKVTGDGVLGLSRAVLVAGARCFIVTLWPIEDSSTTSLMKEFYTQYKVHKNAPRAMRLAILQLLHQNLGIGYWGAFVVFGVSPGMLA